MRIIPFTVFDSDEVFTYYVEGLSIHCHKANEKYNESGIIRFCSAKQAEQFKEMIELMLAKMEAL